MNLWLSDDVLLHKCHAVSLHFVTFAFLLPPVGFHFWDCASTKIPVPIYHFQVITWMVPCEWLWKWSPHTSCCSPCAPCWSWALFTTPLGSYISMCGVRSLVSATSLDSNIYSSHYPHHLHCSKVLWHSVCVLLNKLSDTCLCLPHVPLCPYCDGTVLSFLNYFLYVCDSILPPPSSGIRLTHHLFHQTTRCCGI